MADIVLLCVHSSDLRTDGGKNAGFQKKKDRGTIASEKIFVYIYGSECGANPAFFIIRSPERKARITESLKTHIEPLVEAAGAHLVELVFRPLARRRVVEVYVDTEDGITADLLAELSRSIGKAIEDGALVTEAYQLVVSSPGLDRPLLFPWQYRRHLGRTVRLVRSGDTAPATIEGRILEVDEGQLVVSQGAGGLPVPFDQIEKATIVATLQGNQ